MTIPPKLQEAQDALNYDMVQKTADFNSQVVGFPIPEVPTLLSASRVKFRANFMREELLEFEKAHEEGNLDEAVDALIDFLYVACGALNEMGVLTRPCFDNVHNKNMLKKRGQLSKRPDSVGYDAVKPEAWTPPTHADYLKITQKDIAFLLSKPSRKIIITGYGRHGKDTVCDILKNQYGLNFTSSSWFLAEKVVFPALANSHGYFSVDECYSDRSNHRKLWFDLLVKYNTPDLSRLGREIFAENDIYCGLRNRNELEALDKAGYCDLIVWVDASKRMPLESSASCTIDASLADVILDNNGSLEDLEIKIKELVEERYPNVFTK